MDELFLLRVVDVKTEGVNVADGTESDRERETEVNRIGRMGSRSGRQEEWCARE